MSTFTQQQLQTLQVSQLQAILMDMGLSSIGTKPMLISRILDNQQFPPLDDRRQVVLQHILSPLNYSFNRSLFVPDFLPNVQSYEQLVADQELQLRNMPDEVLAGVEGLITIMSDVVIAQALGLAFTGQESLILSEGQPVVLIIPQ